MSDAAHFALYVFGVTCGMATLLAAYEATKMGGFDKESATIIIRFSAACGAIVAALLLVALLGGHFKF